MQPGGSWAGPCPTPAPTHPLPPASGLRRLESHSQSLWGIGREGRELLMLLGGQWGDKPPVSPEPPMLTTHPSVFAVLIDEFTVG